MKIEDLNFETHPAGMGGTRARVDFKNGYGASVITGEMFYTSEGAPYELAVFKDGSICYETPITDDVLGYLTAEEVEATLTKIEALPEPETV